MWQMPGNLVRGVLYITVHNAKDLPPNETMKSKVTGFFKQTLGMQKNVDHMGVYVNVTVGDNRVATTSTFEHGDELNPSWEENFRIDIAMHADEIAFTIMGDQVGPDKTVAVLKFNGSDVMHNPDNPSQWRLLPIGGHPPPQRHNEYYQLVDKHGQLLQGSYIKVSMNFVSVQRGNQITELNDGYFSVRQNCKVTLYQDACTPYSPLHQGIRLADGSCYIATNAFKDIYEAIVNAQHFIYITGWSVWTDVVLVRDEGFPPIRLGDILKDKANSGVRVLGMVWDEKASTLVTPGLMGTHDEETANFFKSSNAHVILVYRNKQKGLAVDQAYTACFSHHQKCVIVDAPHPTFPDRRRPIAFIGGLDLTSGRYDTPDHHLFSTLTTCHKGDFYQNCTKVDSSMGPRQPWHDIHSKIEGPIVLDTLKNFEERWTKQAPGHLVTQLLNIRDNPMFDTDCSGVTPYGQQWNCQLFRSITSDSAEFDYDKQNTLTKKAKGPTDDSIHRCYVHQIRRAERFIYIENQYFLGSAYAWNTNVKPKCHHIIPFELMEKVIEKIEANETFHVYIVVPMFPEGDPSSDAVQEILHWQSNTVRMMYTKIAEAIRANNRPTKPTDYLSFYCLGKRESRDPDHLPFHPDPNSNEAKLRQTRRFMIYVHSKMMIVDDSYIIVGSANINQRSMSGTRDTEIAVGSFQPNFLYSGGGFLPKGSVHGFRMALFAEHLKVMEPVFEDPSSPYCINRVAELARANWDAYVSPHVLDTYGYLMPYPYAISEHDGGVWPMANCDKFPDTHASILGKKSTYLPDKLTT